MSDFCSPPRGAKDLDEIWEYIAADSLESADRVAEEIYQAIRSLVRFPRQWHRRPDLTSKLRFQSLRDYLIAYAPEESPLLVVAVLHGRRNPRVIATLLSGRE
jgi:toxin ParE1/3/4